MYVNGMAVTKQYKNEIHRLCLAKGDKLCLNLEKVPF